MHSVFYVSMLPDYFLDGSHVIYLDSIDLDLYLIIEEELLAIQDIHVRKLRTKEIISLKILWKHRPVGVDTW